MSAKQVTAHSFWEATCDFTDKDSLLAKFDALLSQARQEARREALKEMDDLHVIAMETHRFFFPPQANTNAVNRILELRQEYSGK